MSDRMFASIVGHYPVTVALQRVMSTVRDQTSADDLLFLERWEMQPSASAGTMLRVGQIRRANPELAAEIRAELKRGRPLTSQEREKLLRS